MSKQRVEFKTVSELAAKVAALDSDALMDFIWALGSDLVDAREQVQARRVRGYCPMGCGKTLTMGYKGHIECVNAECEQPHAASHILAGGREQEHIVQVHEDVAEGGWTAKHPLKERIADRLFECTIGAAMLTSMAQRLEPGLYRVSRSPIGPGGWQYERIEEDSGD